MYRYAIIGFGGLGKLHANNLLKTGKERGDICLVAVCGADKESFLQNVKLNIGKVSLLTEDFADCHFYEDYRELIDREKPDFILSTVPTYLHEEIALYALERGVHVFSEKPMALSVEGCDRMIRAARENNRKLMIGQCLRFDPVFVKIKEYIDHETFGRPYRATFSRYTHTPSWTWNNWILDPEKSGGCLLDLHIHDVDLINWLFGLPKGVHSAMTEGKLKVESIFTQYYYNDLLVMAHADWSLPKTFPFTERCQILFEDATIFLMDGVLKIYKDNEVILPEMPQEDRRFTDEIEAFLDYVIYDKPCLRTSPESIRNSVWLAMQELESAKKQETLYF